MDPNGLQVTDKRIKTSFTLDYQLVDSEEISLFAKGVYIVLARHEGKDPDLWPSAETIAKKARINHTTAQSAPLKSLRSGIL